MKAIVLGATGLVGTELVDQLLEDDDYESITVLVRRSTGITNIKLNEVIVNFDNPESWKKEVSGDVLFSCMGTTIKTAGSKEAQYKVDFTYQYEAAAAAIANGVKTYVLVSSAGADKNSKTFYTRMKGELDEAVKNLGFKSVSIIKPSLLLGNRKEKRFGEEIAAKMFKLLLPVIPIIRKYKPIPAKTVAMAMINSLQHNAEGVSVYELNEVFELAAG